MRFIEFDGQLDNELGPIDLTSTPAKAKPVRYDAPELDAFADEVNEKYGLPPGLVKAIKNVGERSNQDAVSPKGARSVMQFMPETAKRFGVDVNDPYSAIEGAARYLRTLTDQFKDPMLAVAAYNAGEGNVAKYKGVPPFRETMEYVKRVGAALNPIKNANAGEAVKFVEFNGELDAPASEFVEFNGELDAPADPRKVGIGRRSLFDMERYIPEVPGGVIQQTANRVARDILDTPKTNAAPDGSVDFARESARINMEESEARIAEQMRRTGANRQTAINQLQAAGIALNQGADPGAVARGLDATAQESTLDWEAREQFKDASPFDRGIAKGGEALKRQTAGLTKFLSEVVLGDDSALGRRMDEVRQTSTNKTDAMGGAGTAFERNLEGAISSIVSQTPGLAVGVFSGGTAVPLLMMGSQVFGDEYATGRERGLDLKEASGRAAVFGAAEIIGERFGLGQLIKGLRGAAQGLPTDQVADLFLKALAREIPGEQLTTGIQFAADKFLPQGLNKEATLADYFNQAKDTLVQTLMQGGMMTGGGIAANKGVRALTGGRDGPAEVQPQAEQRAEPPAAVQPVQAPVAVDPAATPESIFPTEEAAQQFVEQNGLDMLPIEVDGGFALKPVEVLEVDGEVAPSEPVGTEIKPEFTTSEPINVDAIWQNADAESTVFEQAAKILKDAGAVTSPEQLQPVVDDIQRVRDLQLDNDTYQTTIKGLLKKYATPSATQSAPAIAASPSNAQPFEVPATTVQTAVREQRMGPALVNPTDGVIAESSAPIQNDAPVAASDLTQPVISETPPVSDTAPDPYRPLVEALIKRRAAAKEVGKKNLLDISIKRAKQLMEGGDASAAELNKAAAKFEAVKDPVTAGLLRQVAELRAQAGKDKRKATTADKARPTRLTAFDKPIDDVTAADLKHYAKQAGWEQVGGRLIRKSEDYNSPDYKEIVGRTKWIPRAEWYANLPTGARLSQADTEAAVAKAIAGKPMSAKEKRAVEVLIELSQLDRAAEAEAVSNPAVEKAEAALGEVDDDLLADLVDRTFDAPTESKGNLTDAEIDALFGANPEESPRAESAQSVDTGGTPESDSQGSDQARDAGDALELTGETEAKIAALADKVFRTESSGYNDELISSVREAPLDTVTLEIKSKPGGKKWHHAYVSDGKGDLDSVSIGQKTEGWTKTRILDEAAEKRKRRFEQLVRADEARAARNRGIKEKNIRVGVKWKNAEGYLEGKGKVKYDTAEVVGIDDKTGTIELEMYRRGMRSKVRFKTHSNSRFLDNYPTEPLELTGETEAEIAAREVALAESEAEQRRTKVAADRDEREQKIAREREQRQSIAADSFDLTPTAADSKKQREQDAKEADKQFSGQARIDEALYADRSRSSFERFAALGKNVGTPSQALADAEEISGLKFNVPIREVELEPDVPARFLLSERVIEVNRDWNYGRAEGAQYIAEELLHAVDSLSDVRTLSASSKRLAIGKGDIALEVQKHFDDKGAYHKFIEYPLDRPELSNTVKQAELFARLGVLYFGEPELMRQSLPLAYGAFDEIFRIRIDPVTQDVFRKVWTFARRSLRNTQMGGQHRADRSVAPGDDSGSGNGGRSELGRLRESIRRHFQANPLGAKVDFGRSDSRLKTRPSAGFFDPDTDKTSTGADKGLALYSKASWYYSPLARAIESAKQTTAPAQQWKLWLAGNKAKFGLKDDELTFSGINDYLDLRGKDKVTRDEILAFLDDNGVKVQEHLSYEPDKPDPVDQVKDAFIDAGVSEDDAISYAWEYEALLTGSADRGAVEKRFEQHGLNLEDFPTAAITKPKFSSYVLPGGVGYREMLLTLPSKPRRDSTEWVAEAERRYAKKDIPGLSESQKQLIDRAISSGGFKSSHWDQPNVLAHMRFDERTDADGKKTLFVQEIQSDWGQKGKRDGFEPKQEKEWVVRLKKGGAVYRRFGTEAEARRIAEEAPELEVVEGERIVPARIPSAPFVTDTEAWVSLALKRLIAYGVENGFDRVALTTGEQQAERYDLSKQVDEVFVTKTPDGRIRVIAEQSGRAVVNKDVENGKELADVIGKELAEKANVDDMRPGERIAFSGDGLKLGGEGMKAFYDNIVPQVTNKVLKKIGGGRVESTNIEIEGEPSTQPSFDITPQMRVMVEQGLPLFAKRTKTSGPMHTPDTLRAALDAMGNKAPINVVTRAQVDADPDAVAFYRDGQVYLIADAIPSGVSNKRLRGLILHEVGVHAAQLGVKDFDAILRQMRKLKTMGSRAVNAAYKRAEQANAPASHLDEEALGYLVESNPELPIVKRLIAWLRAAIRSLGATWNKWVNELTVDDLVFMAQRAVRKVSAAKGGAGVAYSKREDQTQTEAFKKWFGDSKVVDANGKPLVVYHGTTAYFSVFDHSWTDISPRGNTAGAGFFFAENPKEAEGYTWGGRGSAGSIMPVYLDIRNPYRINADDKHADPIWRRMLQSKSEAKVVREELALRGHDGIHTDLGEWVAFRPEQIKSAIGNVGTFDPNNPSILYSKDLLDEELDINLPDETTGRKVQRYIQDKFNRVKVAERAVVAAGGRITERSSPYLAEERMHGKAETRLENARETLFKPLEDAITAARKAHKLSLDDIQDYLIAKHAKERNAYIRSIDKDNDAGSGVTDARADEIIDAARDAGTLDALELIAEKTRAISEFNLDTMENDGLEPAEYVEALRQWENYVPLKTVDNDGVPGTGRGFSIGGRESKRALGRHSKAGQVLENLMLQTERLIIRSEKNQVANAFLNMVLENPREELWEVAKVKHKRVLNDGEVRFVPNHTAAFADNVIQAKRNGKTYLITVHDPLIARAMKNLSQEDRHEAIDKVVYAMGAINRYLALINTSLNPEFVITNLARDIQTAFINLSAEQSTKMAGAMVKDIRHAIRGAYRVIRKRPGPKTEYQQWYEEYAAEGGKVGFFGLEPVGVRQRQLERLIKRADGNLWWNGVEGAKAIGKYIMDMNATIENATRLAAYANARKAGFSKAQAASLAKNLTVNFNRKGELGTVINSLYLFANASIQGTARLAQMVKSKRGKAIFAGIAVGAFALDAFNRAISAASDGEDEDPYKRITDFEKQRNLIIMRLDGTYYKFPLPYGYNVPYVIGAQIGSLLDGDKPIDVSLRVLHAVVESFNPLGGADLYQFAAPTIADPFVQVATNKSFSGSPLRPENNKYAPEPDSQLAFKSASPTAKWMAERLNAATGGNEVRPGWWDWAPSTYEIAASTIFGGAGRFAANLYRYPAGTSDKMPIAHRFYGTPPEWYDSKLFYENMREVDTVARELKALVEKGEDPTMFIEKNIDKLQLEEAGDQYNKAIGQINEQLRMTQDEAEIESLERMKKDLMKDFNRSAQAN